VTTSYPTPFRRILITVPAMMATTLVAVDITIANVALPHMQPSLSAAQDQIVWVLTSYLVAAAIATPLSGWLASRFGRKLVMIASVSGFTVASALCGLANDMQMMVLARIVQGACGAALVPLSQAILLDINPPQDHPKAMAIFSMGSLAGPIIGPTLGGYLTDAISWRWVFFINIPFGVLALLGMLAFLSESRDRAVSRFDIFGFMTISIAVGAFQLLIDRGEQLDWFDSVEIQLYAAVLALSLYLAIVHMFTARDTFIRPQLFLDRNFSIGCAVSLLIGVLIFATMPMIILMTQNLIGYTAFRTGLVGIPRVVGTLVAMILITRLSRRFDARMLIIAGLSINALSMLMYSHMDLYVDQWTLIVTGFVQGFGGGMIFVPLSVSVFSTLARHLRNEGAAMYSLTRNIGNAVGISFIQRELVHHTAHSKSYLVEGIRPDSPAFQSVMPDFDFSAAESLAKLNLEVTRQASMVGNVEVFKLIFVLSLVLTPLILLMRAGKAGAIDNQLPIME